MRSFDLVDFATTQGRFTLNAGDARTSVNAADFDYIGTGLVGPECVLAEATGEIWTTYAPGGLSRIQADGTTDHVLMDFTDYPEHADTPLQPNGFCRDADGSFLVADMLGRRVLRMRSDGRITNVLSASADGDLGQVNYIHRDRRNRIWIVVQSSLASPDEALNPHSKDGSILYWDGIHPPRTMVSGLMHPNQIAVSTDGREMYVPQTTARNILRFSISASGQLTNGTVFGPGDHGALVDGVALDADGWLWGTHPGADRVFCIAPDGTMHTVFEDGSCRDSAKALYDAFMGGYLDASHVESAGGTVAPLTTSVAFAGPDLDRVLVGSLGGERVAYFRSPVAGQMPAHWRDTRPDDITKTVAEK